MVTIDDVRAVARALPRTEEHLIRDRVKFRVGRIVYVAFSRDETVMGFGYPREERDALVNLMRELVVDAWRMCVPKRVAAAYPG